MTTRRRRSVTFREFVRLFPEFAAPSWAAWMSIADAIFGHPPADADLVRRVTGRSALPTKQVLEAWFVIARAAGKSRFAALLVTFFATARTYERAAGELVYCAVIAPDRKQGGVTFRYITGLLHSVPTLNALVVSETRDSIELSNGVVVEVVTASTAAPRGRSYALVIVEEAAFLPADDAADPDRELLRAVRPALARVPGSLLLVVSSPYSPRGELYRTWRERFGKDDAHVLVVQADTATMNPTFNAHEIARAYSEDEASALAEYGAQFRRDIETYIGAEAVEAVTASERFELPPVSDRAYVAFVDPAGGSGADAMTLAVAHVEMRGEQAVAVLDALREARPPFSPEAIAAEFAVLAQTYGADRVVGDRYAGEWPREQFRKHGVAYELSERVKSDIYREMLPMLNSGAVELLDHRRLRAQLAGLERRGGRGGRDSIDHVPGGHDDLANAAAGALLLAYRAAAQPAELILVGGHAASLRPANMDEAQRRADEQDEVRRQASAQVIAESVRSTGVWWPGSGGRGGARW